MQISSQTFDGLGLSASPASFPRRGRQEKPSSRQWKSEVMRTQTVSRILRWSNSEGRQQLDWERRRAGGNHWQPVLFGDFPCADLVTWSKFRAYSVLGFRPNSK